MRLVSPENFSNDAIPFGTAREIEVGMGLARAHRVTYVGKLYVRIDQAVHAFETLEAAGADVGLKLCSLHALDSCRIEKAYRHFGHDITDEVHVLEAGLGFAVRTKKGDFIGRDAVLAKREKGLARRLVQLRLRDPEPLLFHYEAIVRNGEIVSIITSGNYAPGEDLRVGCGLARQKRRDVYRQLHSTKSDASDQGQNDCFLWAQEPEFVFGSLSC